MKGSQLLRRGSLLPERGCCFLEQVMSGSSLGLRKIITQDTFLPPWSLPKLCVTLSHSVVGGEEAKPTGRVCMSRKGRGCHRAEPTVGPCPQGSVQPKHSLQKYSTCVRTAKGTLEMIFAVLGGLWVWLGFHKYGGGWVFIQLASGSHIRSQWDPAKSRSHLPDPQPTPSCLERLQSFPFDGCERGF